MRAVQLSSYSDPPELRVVEMPTPEPGPGELLVKIHAAPVNPSDLAFVKGLYGFKKPLPCVPGFEGSGVVVAGNGIAARALVGRRVAVSAPNDGGGTWAEYIVQKPNGVIPLLPGVDIERAASLIVNPLTAHALMEIAREGKHRAIVQSAAASQLGRMILRLGLARKVPIVHVVRRRAQVELLRGMGAPFVLDSSEPDFEKTLKDTCKRLEVTIAFDAVGGATTGQLVDAIGRRGEVVVYGALAEEPCAINPGTLIFGEKKVEGFWLTKWIKSKSLPELIAMNVAVQRRLDKELSTEIKERIPLEAAEQGLERYRGAMTDGKVLFVP